MLDFLFGKNEKSEILDWLEEHDTPSYHGVYTGYGYRTNRYYYEDMYSLDQLKAEKRNLIKEHERYEFILHRLDQLKAEKRNLIKKHERYEYEKPTRNRKSGKPTRSTSAENT